VAARAVSSVHLGVATGGGVVAIRRPRHPVGWLLLAIALLPNASMPLIAYANYGLAARPVACLVPAGPTCTCRRSPSRRWPCSASCCCSPHRLAAVAPLALVDRERGRRAGRVAV